MSQKWYQSKCSKERRELVLRLLFVFSIFNFSPVLSLTSVHAEQRLAIPKLLKEVENHYSQSATLSANFVQIIEDASFSKKKKKSSGKIFFKRPSKVRWEVTQPETSLLVSNGQKYLYYTPPFDSDEKGQLLEKKSSEVQSKLAESLLAGSFSMKQIKKIEQKSPISFQLIPQPKMAGTVIRATIEVDPDQKLIRKVILEHQGGNHSELTLSQIELGPLLSDSLFEFIPPPNTDVIKN